MSLPLQTRLSRLVRLFNYHYEFQTAPLSNGGLLFTIKDTTGHLVIKRRLSSVQLKNSTLVNLTFNDFEQTLKHELADNAYRLK